MSLENLENFAALKPVIWRVPSTYAGERLDRVLAEQFPAYSRSQLQQWIKHQQVYVDGLPQPAKVRLRGHEEVTVFPLPSPPVQNHEPETMPLSIVFEDACLLVLNKAAGCVVHPAPGHGSGTLLNGLLAYHPPLREVPRAGIVHRLDKDTSGLLVVAKTREAQYALVQQLQARTVGRIYWALVKRLLFSAAVIDAPIGRHPRDRLRMAVVGAGRGKEAITAYRPLARLAQTTLIECQLNTGRTHQIRVHCQSIGAPLFGDPLYGGGASCAIFPRQALHARRLELIHPASGEKCVWEIPLADDFRQLLYQLNDCAEPFADLERQL